MSQIRITKNDQIVKALKLLQAEYPLLNEAEIIKMALSVALMKVKKDYAEENRRYLFTENEEKSLHKAMENKKHGKGFTSDNIDEIMNWLDT